jgi:protein TonB
VNTPARYAQCPAPVYPDKARRAALTGTVLLSVEIDESGRPLSVAVRNSSGHELLDQTAMRAVRKWRFEPARSRGKNIGARLEIPIRFARS